MHYKALMCQGEGYSSVTYGDTFSHKRRQNTTRLCAYSKPSPVGEVAYERSEYDG
ncbi:MAG: hypothetical protein IJF05_02890 [Clostridia bacterium]|nr:hypothetical protein [Clostridia bacterium]